jgi:hypothetical protein
MTSERLLAILKFNSWGSPHTELGVSTTRGEALHSLIGGRQGTIAGGLLHLHRLGSQAGAC